MRLIDADALIEDIKSFWDWDSIDGITATTVLKQTMTDISNASTIDAVPVRHGRLFGMLYAMTVCIGEERTAFWRGCRSRKHMRRKNEMRV